MLRALALIAALVAIAIGSGHQSLAHERRTVGPYQLVVGFVDEPAFLGATNGVSLRVTDTRSTPAAAVEGLQDTLAVEVFHGGLTRSLRLDFGAVFGQPGLYAAHFVPTAAGSYIFRIHGRIRDLAIDERFESGPGRFDDVEPVSALQYPDQVPAGDDLGRALADLRAASDQARVLGVLAILIGLGALGLAVVRSRRT